MNRFPLPLLFLLLLQGFFGQAQTLDWGINIGGHVDEYPNDIHKVPGGIILSSSVDGLRKYDSDGNLLWSFNFFNNVHDSYFISATDVDEKGNIYAIMHIGGNYGHSISINEFEFLVGLNLVKIDPEGEILWVRQIGGSNGLVKYRDRNVYITGKFMESININKEKSFTSTQYYDCFSWIYRYGDDLFVAKFSDMGVLEKAVQHGNDYNDYPASMQVDASGNIFLAAMHEEYACVTSFSYMLRYDKELNLVWEKKVTTEERDDFLITPKNLFLSENGYLYLVAGGFYGVSNEEFEIPDNLEWTYSILEYDPETADFQRLNSYAKGNWNEAFVPPSPFMNNMYLQDYKDEIIVFISANQPLSFVNKDFTPQPKQENLLLFSINKKTFESSYITHFEAELPRLYPDYAAIDNPGRTLMDGNKLYITAAFQANPLHMFGEQIPNNSGNNDRDILLAKLDLSALADPGDEKDNDGDGVINYKDYCTDTTPGAVVDARGCSAVQKDLDLDGVANEKDLCPDTRAGVAVDNNGCEILQFPADNFVLSTTSETCKDANDASIKVEVKDGSYEYFLRFHEEEEVLALNGVTEITGLQDGVYEICISVTGYSPYEKCFTLTIAPLPALNVYSAVNNAGTAVRLQLSGGEEYTIQHNDRTIRTTDPFVDLRLEKGSNQIAISTDKPCQGIFQETIFGGPGLLLHPNPVADYFSIERGAAFNGPLVVEVYNYEGRLLLSKTFAEEEDIQVDVSGFAAGNYFIRTTSETGVENFKIIKK